MAKKSERKTVGMGREENLINLRDRTPEERRAIQSKGGKKSKQKHDEKMQLQQMMKSLLNMPVAGETQKAVLQHLGFADTEMNNKALLMASLFRKGINGDVSAIKEILAQMEKLDMFEDTGRIHQGITINLVPVGMGYSLSRDEEEEVERAEQGLYDDLSDETEQDWDDDW